MTSPNPFIDLDGKLNLLPSKFNRLRFNTGYTITGNEFPGEIYWNITDDTLDLKQNGATLQVGQEMNKKVRNVTGTTIFQPSAVYESGQLGNRATIDLAKGDSESTSKVIGVTTEDILNNTDGKVTTVGLVRQIKTDYVGTGVWGTTWKQNDDLWVSKTVAGQLTNVEPDVPHHSDRVGKVSVVGGIGIGAIDVQIDRHVTLSELSDVNGTPLDTTGLIPVWDNDRGVFDFTYNPLVTKDPTGFDRSVSASLPSLSFDDSTRTFTIAPIGDNFYYYDVGKKTVYDSPMTVVIPDIEGLHFIYFENDVLLTSTTPWDFNNGKVFVSVVYWDAVNNKSCIGDELHGLMPWEVHHYLHNTRGSQYISGFSPELTVDGNGSLDAHAEMQSISAGVFYDEDIEHTNGAQTTYEKWYKEGANADWRWTTADSALVDMGTTYPYYNEFTGGVWQRTEVPNTKFFMMHIFATNKFSTNNKVIVVMGENYYDTKGAAQDAAPTEILGLTTGVLPTPEFLEIGTVIIQVSTAYSNSYNARVVSTSDGGDFVDFRSNEKIGVGASTNHHGNLTGLGEDDHTQYLLTDGSRDVTGDLRGVDFVPITSGVVNRDVNGDVSSIEYDNRTVTITRSSGLITSYTDGVNTWTITRDVNDVITGWTVS